jgi:hypothetical protein
MFGCPVVGLCGRELRPYGSKATGSDVPAGGFGSRAIGGNPPPVPPEGESLRFSENDALMHHKRLTMQGPFQVEDAHPRTSASGLHLGDTWFAALRKIPPLVEITE